MKYPTIRLEGSILSADILNKIEQGELQGQKTKDFWMDGSGKVKDEIVKAWADAQDMWRIYQRRIESIPHNKTGTSETRNFWMVPLLSLLGYDVQLYRTAQNINNKSYAISHYAANLDSFPLHIMGFNDSLDKKRLDSGPRMSPHALMQEYINLNEHLFAIVSNGLTIRLLRDSSRLIKLSFLEFDLERMFNENHFSDFALMFRLLHASRMPVKQGEGSESLIEGYHQDSLDSGSRIREGLSNAVEHSIISIANGFLTHPDNNELREAIIAGNISAKGFYQYQLHLIYRLLFLMVIEERDLIFERETPKDKRDIYYNYYSVNRIRNLSEKRYLAEAQYSDLWISLKNTFRLFETEYFGEKLEIKPLAGELFGKNAIGYLNNSSLNNKILLECLKNLSVFTNPNTGQIMRVNYGSLNVEEFGSVYEGLLEYDPDLNIQGKNITFNFIKGTGRSSSGSHYTPDELVQPLIKHSLDYIIEDKLKESEAVSSQIANSELVSSEIANRALSVNEIKLILGDDHGFSQRGSVRDDQPDAQSRNFDPSEYSRRLGQKLYERIHSLYKDSSRQPERTGDSSSAQRSGASAPRSSNNSGYESQQRNWQDAAITYLQSHKPQAILKLLPDSTRYILLANRSLLAITVCDVACGSGHILLNAARRIANHLVKIRTGEDQPSPAAFRQAVRDVIQHCIYGVDKNPLAVELAKIALWLEAHNPGEPLNFLDHHIKCGDAIVGLAHKEELQNGIPDEAFKSLPGDDKDICKELRDRNKLERKSQQKIFDFSGSINKGVTNISELFNELDLMPENTPEQIEDKRNKYNQITSGTNYWNLKLLADIMTAQFFISKTKNNYNKIITDAQYRNYLQGEQMLGQAIAQAQAKAVQGRFFHWFLEFPEIFNDGGFDCILGNPPYLGGQKLTGSFGNNYCEFIRYNYAPIGSVDLITYFFRRIFTLIRDGGYQSLISTNTIAQGNAREGGVAVIYDQGGTINFAVRSMKWPGLAAVEVSLISIHKGDWKKKFILDNKEVKQITTYLDDTEDLGEPYQLAQNANKSFQGSIVLGMGFILEPEEAQRLISKNPKNKDVLFPYLNGQDLNNNIDQSPSRWVINFFDWEEEYCKENYPDCFEIIEREIKPERTRWKLDKNGNEIVGEYQLRKPLPQKWWIYGEKRPTLYRTIAPLERMMAHARVTKTHAFSYEYSNIVASDATVVFAYQNYFPFAILQSTLHEKWSWNYSSTMKGDRRYAPSDCFETFPFPQNISVDMEAKLERIGEKYHEFRHQFMQKLQLGLTKTYNQFHNEKLSSEIASSEIANGGELEKKFGKDTVYLWNHLQKTQGTCSMEEAIKGITKLRQLHKDMDEAVLEAYGWHIDSEDGQAIDLKHDFYEVDYLPENDRVRYTISPEARKEVLKRLLLLNHKIYAEEVKQGLHDKKGKKSTSGRAVVDNKTKSISLKKQKSKTDKSENDKQQFNIFSTIAEAELETQINEEGLLTTFHVGQHVLHEKYGKGEIVHISGSGEKAKLTVKFGKEMKIFIAGLAKLKKIILGR
jgi:hypothetical protein